MSVEDNKDIEEEFNRILSEEYKQDWETIVIPPKIVALFCYSIPALMLISSQDYHHQNVMAVLFFSFIVGAGFHGFYRYHTVVKAFFSNEKPVSQVIRDIRAQEALDERSGGSTTNSLTEVAEQDWDAMMVQLEHSMDTNLNPDSDVMNVSTIFDRAESEQATLAPPTRTSWFKRLFRRN
jgi:hypothetical protein